METEVIFDQTLGSIAVPPGVPANLLEAWIDKEKKKLYAEKAKEERLGHPRSLGKVFATYIGVLAMILAVTLGLFQEQSTAEILDTACRSLIVYGIIGFFAGLIAEHVLRESVETVVREVVKTD